MGSQLSLLDTETEVESGQGGLYIWVWWVYWNGLRTLASFTFIEGG